MPSMQATALRAQQGSERLQWESSLEEGLADDSRNKETERAVRESVRDQCLSALRDLMSTSAAFTERDLAAYRDRALSESSLEIVGYREHEQKLRALEENRRLHIPATIAKVRAMDQWFRAKIDEAQGKGWISSTSAKRWKEERLRSEAMHWWQKQSFLLDVFPRYLKNWEQLSADMKTIEKRQRELGAYEKDIPELATIKGAQFGDMHYTFRRSTADRALAALAAMGQGRSQLYKLAEGKLSQAASRGVLSPWKVGTWLRRIFEGRTTLKEINAFLTGAGSSHLDRLVKNWAEARRRFDAIEGQRKKGTPPTFHFVSLKVFLDWDYHQRLTYLDQAQSSFRDISKEHPRLLDIRRELAAKDWDSAKDLIEKAKRGQLTEEQRAQLRSMEEYLKQHGKEKIGMREKPDPATEVSQALQEMRQALAQLPISLQHLYLKAIGSGYGVLHTLCSLMYNRIWCREHGHLDDDREARLKQSTTKETQHVVRKGHGKGFENNDVTSYRQPAIRTYHDGEWSPQILHVSPGGHGALIEALKSEQSNHAFKYWTTMLPEGVSYDVHKHIHEDINPTLKRGMRTLAKHGFAFSLIGSPVAIN